MRYNVVNLAENDLASIIDYIVFNDCIEHAVYVYEHIKEEILSLENFPQRGHIPRECDIDYDLLEVHFKVYRIIYKIIGNEVVILAVIDSRRKMEEQFLDAINREISDENINYRCQRDAGQ